MRKKHEKQLADMQAYYETEMEEMQKKLKKQSMQTQNPNTLESNLQKKTN